MTDHDLDAIVENLKTARRDGLPTAHLERAFLRASAPPLTPAEEDELDVWANGDPAGRVPLGLSYNAMVKAELIRRCLASIDEARGLARSLGAWISGGCLDADLDRDRYETDPVFHAVVELIGRADPDLAARARARLELGAVTVSGDRFVETIDPLDNGRNDR